MIIEGKERNNSIRRKEAKLEAKFQRAQAMVAQYVKLQMHHLMPTPPRIRRSAEKLVNGKLFPDPDLFNDPTPLLYSQRNSQLMLGIKFRQGARYAGR
jgi:hypothetical protein